MSLLLLFNSLFCMSQMIDIFKTLIHMSVVLNTTRNWVLLSNHIEKGQSKSITAD
jgi:hypothetical protein